MNDVLERALQVLRWGSEQESWSASVSPEQCRALVEAMQGAVQFDPTSYDGREGFIYLAVPYTHADAEIRAARFKAANRAAGILMRRGDVVFSPISHGVPISGECGLPTDWNYWQDFARAYLSAAKRLVVLCIGGWETSIGVRAEIAIAVERGIPVEFMRLDGDLVVIGEIHPSELEREG